MNIDSQDDVLSASGRIDQRRFAKMFLAMIGYGLCHNLLSFVIFQSDVSVHFLTQVLWFIVLVLSALVVAYIWACTLIKRLHDIDTSGWYAILGFIPVLGLAVGAFLVATRGVEGSNQYG